MSVWRNDIKCEYMLMFHLKKLASEELIWSSTLVTAGMNVHGSRHYTPNYLKETHICSSISYTEAWQGDIHSTWNSLRTTYQTTWLIMTQPHKEPGHQQPLKWPSLHRTFCCVLGNDWTLTYSYFPKPLLLSYMIHQDNTWWWFKWHETTLSPSESSMIK